jgi:iron complex outermembrane recepter protein
MSASNLVVFLAASALIPSLTRADGPMPTDQASLAEIVVTAQRREERLKDVPISITAVTGAQLEQAGVANTTDLQQITPGLLFANAGAFAEPTIRGIGTAVTSGGSDANVAIYVDGVYMPSQESNVFEFSDIQRIEVLKGPQGTLYGRNATGGAINITTLAPSFDPHGDLSASYGSFNETTVKGFLSGPIVADKLAVSVSAIHDDDDGYVKNNYDNGHLGSLREDAGRIKALWTPTDKLGFTLSVDVADISNLQGYSLKPLGGNTAIAGAAIPINPYQVSLNDTPVDHTRSYGASLTGTYDFDMFRLSEITAYRSTDVSILTDLDRTAQASQYASFGSRQRTFTQEIDLNSTADGPLRWVGGAYFYHDRANEDNLNVSGFHLFNTAQVGSRSGALFGQIDYKVLPQLVFTAGLRYSVERRDFFISQTEGYEAVEGGAPTLTASKTWSAATPRVALRYDLTEDSNIYASYSEGFKSGTYNTTTFSGTPVNPEKVHAYETGFKFARGPLSLDAAAFYYDYTNLQVQVITPATGLTTLENAASAEIYGAEVQFQGQVDQHFRLNAGVAWTHSRYVSFPNAVVFVPQATAAQCPTNPNRPCGNAQAAADVSGREMIRTPELTANIGISYSQSFPKGRLNAALNEYVSSQYFWDASNRLKQPAYQILNAELGWSPAGSNWTLSVWSKNLANALYEYYVTDSATGDDVSYAPPRQIGVKLNYKF